MTKMRGALYNGVKDVTLRELEKPTAGPGELIVRNTHAGICGTDLTAYLYDGEAVGILPGNSFGHEMVGVVDAVGEGVDIEVGTRVFVNPNNIRTAPEGWNPVMNTDMAGAFNEYIKVENPEYDVNLFKLPENVPNDKAVLTEPLSVAMHAVNRSEPRPGDKVVIYGAGPIGLGVLAGMRAKGVEDIIVSDILPTRLEKVKEMGGVPFNSKEGDFITFIKETWGTNPDNFGGQAMNADIVVDTAGFQGVLEEYLAHAKLGSKFIMVALSDKYDKISPTVGVLREVNILGAVAYQSEDIRDVIDMLADPDAIVEPMITSVIPLSDVTEAFETAADKENQVKVVLDLKK